MPVLTDWLQQDLAVVETLEWQRGLLCLKAELRNDELWLAHRYKSAADATGEDWPEDLQWNRWGLKKGSTELIIQPALPELSLVLRPKFPFGLKPGVKARVYAGLPHFAQLLLGNVAIVTLPLQPQKKTWFGTFQGGELCYSVRSSVRREPEPLSNYAYRAICPIEIINRSDEDLQIEKIRIQVDSLAIYRSGDQLWTNEIQVQYQYHPDASEVSVGSGSPREIGRIAQWIPARDRSRRSLTTKTFEAIMDLPGFGIFNR